MNPETLKIILMLVASLAIWIWTFVMASQVELDAGVWRAVAKGCFRGFVMGVILAGVVLAFVVVCSAIGSFIYV